MVSEDPVRCTPQIKRSPTVTGHAAYSAVEGIASLYASSYFSHGAPPPTPYLLIRAFQSFDSILIPFLHQTHLSHPEFLRPNFNTPVTKLLGSREVSHCFCLSFFVCIFLVWTSNRIDRRFMSPSRRARFILPIPHSASSPSSATHPPLFSTGGKIRGRRVHMYCTLGR